LRHSKVKMFVTINKLVRTFLVTLLSLDIVMSEGLWGRKVEARRKTEQRAEQEDNDDGEGTYNPKSAWMFVDSRRRVLPDIDGNKLESEKQTIIMFHQLRPTLPVLRTTSCQIFTTTTWQARR
jgi:hypothetical protein